MHLQCSHYERGRLREAALRNLLSPPQPPCLALSLPAFATGLDTPAFALSGGGDLLSTSGSDVLHPSTLQLFLVLDQTNSSAHMYIAKSLYVLAAQLVIPTPVVSV